jgi:hypothetical protein
VGDAEGVNVTVGASVTAEMVATVCVGTCTVSVTLGNEKSRHAPTEKEAISNSAKIRFNIFLFIQVLLRLFTSHTGTQSTPQESG